MTHNVLPYEIAAGVPARHLGWRFDQPLRDRLDKVEWWNFPFDIIEKHVDLFDQELTNEVIMELENIKSRINANSNERT